MLLRAVLLAVAASWVVGLPAMLRVLVFNEQFILAIVGLAAALVFLDDRSWRWPALRAVDVVLAALVLIAFGAMVFAIPRLMAMPIRPAWTVWVAAFMIVVVLEATRRKTGPVLPILVISLVAVFTFIGPNLPAAFQSRPLNLTRLTPYLVLDSNAMMGRVMVIVGVIVLPFILFGYLLNAFGGSQFFTALANRLVGRFRGGPAKVSLAGSAAFGMVSGSAVANVVAVGSVSIPMMARTGYRKHVAAAIEAISSTGGQLMPPIMGASAFLMAEFLEIPYQDIVVAAVLPAVFFYLALFVAVDFETRRLDLAPSGAIANGSGGAGWFASVRFLLPVAVLLYLLFVERRTPGNASVFTILTLMVTYLAGPLGEFGQRFKTLVTSTLSSMGATTEIILLAATASFVIGVLQTTGFASAVTIQIVIISAGSLAVLLVLAGALSIVLGMGMPTVGVYILLALLAAPALIQLGIEPLAAHLYVLYFGMLSMITPPVAIASFAAASVAGADPWRTSFASLKVGAGVFLVPIAFVTQPELLFIGEFSDTAIAAGRLAIAVTLAGSAAIGHGFRRLPAYLRALAAALAAANVVAFTGSAGDVLLWACLAAGIVLLAVNAWPRLSRLKSNRMASEQ